MGKPLCSIVLALAAAWATPAFAEDVSSLKGQFTFNWFSDPEKARCIAVGDELLAEFMSSAYQCNLTPVTNTASGEPARVCTKSGETAEYLIFATQKACDSERETQASNSED